MFPLNAGNRTLVATINRLPKMKQAVSILFIPKYHKPNKLGEVPIYCRITVNGKRAEMTTGIFVNPNKWNQTSEAVIGKGELVESMNHSLRVMRADLLEHKYEIKDQKHRITAQKLKSKYLGIEAPTRNILDVFNEYNMNLKDQVGHGYSHSTWKRYETTKRHVKKFLKEKYMVSDLSLKEVKLTLANDFFQYLRTKQEPCEHNSAIKYIKNVKSVFNYAVDKEYLDINPIARFKVALKEMDKVYLTSKELEKVESKYFGNYRLEKVRDVFLFCCYTGLAHVDVDRLAEDNLQGDINKDQWININRSKTGVKSRIKVISKAKAILDKYKDDPLKSPRRLLPIPSNQKANAYLKEIADLCGIEKKLTFHVARHTFATMLLNNGVSLDSVAYQLGHKRITQTQHYAELLGKTVAREMNKFEKRLKKKSKKEKTKKGKGFTYIE